jgi:hypothetical protein
MRLSHDQALGLFTFGTVFLIFGGLQTVTGRDMMSKTNFLGPSPRWVGGIVAAVGSAGVVIGAIALWLTS